MHSQVVELSVLQDGSLLTEMLKVGVLSAQVTRNRAAACPMAATSPAGSPTTLIIS